jgi:hypothetical protein
VQYAGMKTGASSICVLAFWSFHQFVFADGGDTAASPAPLNAQIDFILDHPLPESEYSQSDRCVYANEYDAIEVLDSRRLLFRGRRGAYWLNQLRSECLGLTRDGVLILEGRSRSVCDMDSFRSVPRRAVVQISDLSGAQFGMSCMLGHFEAISEAQAMVLRDALSKPAYVPALKPKANEDD